MSSPEKEHYCLECKCDCDIEQVGNYSSFYVSVCCCADFLTYDEKDLTNNGVVEQ